VPIFGRPGRRDRRAPMVPKALAMPLDHGRRLDQYHRVDDLRPKADEWEEPVRAENLNPDVLVMQPANQGMRHDASDLLNRARDRRILVQ